MQQMIEWFQALLKPKDKYPACRTAVMALRQLADELNGIASRLNSKQSNSLIEIVAFFQAVSTVQDTHIVPLAADELDRLGGFPSTVQLLQDLNLHIFNGGRRDYGMNRTRPGQKVTSANVFLGNINGYWTMPVSSIEGRSGDTDYYQTMQAQAALFMASHIPPMLRLIREIDRELASTI